MVKFLAGLSCIIISVMTFAQSKDTIAIEKGVSFSLAAHRHAVIRDLAYYLSFNVPSQKAAPVTGSGTITFALSDITQSLQLDFKQTAARVKSVQANGKNIPVDIQQEHLLINNRYLHKGSNQVRIDFIAGDDALNRNDEYLYALFVPDRARTAFPCFDQPDLKAVFTLQLSVPANWNVLANGKLKQTVKTDTGNVFHFAPTEKISTYLFSFTAGKYQSVEKLNMQFLYRETDTTKIRLSVDSVFKLHKDAFQFMEGWTGIPYPFQKVGFVAIPSFQFGGMEHPGEVQYNAPALFLDEGATRDQFISRANLISHETAHMWFGDLVTMEWFNDVWMKEVFANFMADKVTEKIMGSETFNLKFLQDHYPAAYSVDRTPGANAIRQQLDNLNDAGSMYGNIIYHKAPVMMRQLELLMGKENFRKGVQEYLKKYAYGNANWNDLIDILSKHTSAGLPAWNKVWVNQPGRPVFSYSFNEADGSLNITQQAERMDGGIWPQQFSITLVYPDTSRTIYADMRSATFTQTGLRKPLYILFNSDGIGYGLFPAVLNDDIYDLKKPLQRAAAYINAYENMLAGRAIEPQTLLDFLIKGLEKENNEMNLRWIAGHLSSVYWTFLSPAQRTSNSRQLERSLWESIAHQTQPNNKKILFKAYQDVYLSPDAAKQLYGIWQQQQPPAGVKLTEDDYTSLAATIALKTDTVNTVTQIQLNRIANPDRKERWKFLMPALSPDSAQRDRFFMSLSDLSNRRKESWVTTSLSYLNHPLRQASFVKFLPKTLDMLEEIKETGDLFFPQAWLGAIFSNYQTPAAWQVVENFLVAHPAYNPKLKGKILQATDNLNRARKLVK